MNAINDCGGMHGFGPINVHDDGMIFKADWERKVFAIVLAVLAQGVAKVDENRHAIESVGNLPYVSESYFEHWLAAMEFVLVDKGIITDSERRDRVEALLIGVDPPPPRDHESRLAEDLLETLRGKGTYERPNATPPRYGVGAGVVARRINPAGHTRLPRYLRGCRGTVLRHHGAHVLPDSAAAGRGEDPQHLYTVRFEPHEVWGPDGQAATLVHADLWESYLLPASGN